MAFSTSRSARVTAGLLGLRTMPTRRISGITSTNSCACLALKSGARFTKPVIFPPGRARLRTRPMPTGSPTPTMTIGIVAVAALAAREAGVVQATMMSTLLRTSSAVGNLLGRSLRPMIGDGGILPLDVTMPAQGITECPQRYGCRNGGSKKTNPGLFVPLALLRAPRKRPHRRVAEQRDERASLHSITSSAPTNIDAGIVTPIALAV